MKKEKMLLVALAVIVLSVCVIAPAHAYTFTVQNNFVMLDAKAHVQICYGGGCHSINNYGSIDPGETATYANTNWKTAGLCWDAVQVKPFLQWPGCGTPQWTTKVLARCSDTMVLFERDGCNVRIYSPSGL